MGKDIKEKPKLADTLDQHSLSNSLEACDVSAGNEVVAEVILLASCNALLEDVDHDGLELRINLFLSEDSVLSVLAHLDAGASYAAGICSLGRTMVVGMLAPSQRNLQPLATIFSASATWISF